MLPLLWLGKHPKTTVMTSCKLKNAVNAAWSAKETGCGWARGFVFVHSMCTVSLALQQKKRQTIVHTDSCSTVSCATQL
jgi:hypothetical protein